MIVRFLTTIIASFFVLTLLANLLFIWNIFESFSIPWVQKISITARLLIHPTEAFPDTLMLIFSLIIAFLIGINMLLIRYITLATQENPNHPALIAGSVVSQILTVSCVGCSQIASNVVIHLIGTGAALAFLPLQQIVFGIFSILLLLFLFIRLSVRISTINQPLQNQPPPILHP
jgi:hypothetical protein